MKRSERLRLPKARQRKRMGADMQVPLGLHGTGKEECRNRNCAITPPLVTGEQRHLIQADFQNRIRGLLAELDQSHLTNVWDDQDKRIFREKFIEYPKNFGIVASHLDTNSVADCVQYYYLSKKSEDYKQFMHKPRLRTALRSSQRETWASSITVSDSAFSTETSDG
ncbi:hypothetical protein HPB48_017203 [Haemaphysalis longicornis]|uniref:SANT domain-containing protein n=1 Tax=Haemaphysalis longicornis TaxID=44386 RepID=A0A9J6GL22_HAELO|nr:hypothetical protein HPB48_017203 [Haemaphysalis longicornis]